MSRKMNLFLAGVVALFATGSLHAQETTTTMYRGGGYDFADTSLIPAKRIPQQRDFLNSQYDFPSKPRNQWEIGLTAGLLNISGDVRSKSIFNQPIKAANTLAWGLHVRKAWGYVISTRFQYLHGNASGYNYQKSDGYWGHSGNPYNTVGGGYTENVNYSYKTSVSEFSLQVVAALNNLKFHKARNKVSYYALAGVGGLLYNCKVDALDAAGAKYKFSSINTVPTSGHIYEDRKTINKALKDMFDGEYETPAERHDNRPWSGDNTYRTIFTMGGGMQFRLGKRLSLQIEDKITLTNDDLIDGQMWQEQPATTGGKTTSSMTSDFDNYNYFSVGLNVHLGGKSVDPLWWMNPLDYGYNEMKRPRTAPTSKCDLDADNDGISDCFDHCPNTPGGVSVDSHGCPFDTDGDGVPDYKDKQLITPTECQPSDADGVGKCPEPECCKNRAPVKEETCGGIASGSVAFTVGVSKLSTNAMSQLNGLAASMKNSPNCKAVITGNGSGNKVEQQRSWERANSVINFMVEKQGIDRERFIFQYSGMGDSNSVDFRSAAPGEEGPSTKAPPFPNLNKK